MGEIYYSRGYLPHWDEPGATQFITWRLADSLPAEVWAEMTAEANRLGKRLDYRKVDLSLDAGHGSCMLCQPRIAAAMQSHLWEGHGIDYALHSYVVMPNHVHAVVTVRRDLPLAELMRFLKGASARKLNLVLGREGRLWQPDYFDRLIRDEDHFYRTVDYIEWNPVRAKLCTDPRQFRFSSAFPSNAARLTVRTEVRGPDAD